MLAGGAALADKLGIPKAILCIAGNLAPIPGHTYGSGSNLLSTVPQWGTQLPQRMVTPAMHLALDGTVIYHDSTIPVPLAQCLRV